METNNNWIKIGLVVLLAIAAVLGFVFQDQLPAAMATSSAVQVPAAINTAIEIGTIILLTAGFGWIFKLFGLDLRGLVPVIGVALSSFIVAEFQNIVNLIPATFDPFVSTFFYLITLLLAPLGGLFLLRKKDEDPARLL